jgi:hypothetical protein
MAASCVMADTRNAASVLSSTGGRIGLPRARRQGRGLDDDWLSPPAQASSRTQVSSRKRRRTLCNEAPPERALSTRPTAGPRPQRIQGRTTRSGPADEPLLTRSVGSGAHLVDEKGEGGVDDGHLDHDGHRRREGGARAPPHRRAELFSRRGCSAARRAAWMGTGRRERLRNVLRGHVDTPAHRHMRGGVREARRAAQRGAEGLAARCKGLPLAPRRVVPHGGCRQAVSD